MNKRYWLIRGYDCLELIFEMKVNLGDLNENQLRRLLQVLAAKEGLSYNEVVCAMARRGSKISNDHLAVRKEPDRPVYQCGSNPYFTASVVDENGKLIALPGEGSSLSPSRKPAPV
jgi:hypothetical protein